MRLRTANRRARRHQQPAPADLPHVEYRFYPHQRRVMQTVTEVEGNMLMPLLKVYARRVVADMERAVLRMKMDAGQ